MPFAITFSFLNIKCFYKNKEFLHKFYELEIQSENK